MNDTNLRPGDECEEPLPCTWHTRIENIVYHSRDWASPGTVQKFARSDRALLCMLSIEGWYILEQIKDIIECLENTWLNSILTSLLETLFQTFSPGKCLHIVIQRVTSSFKKIFLIVAISFEGPKQENCIQWSTTSPAPMRMLLLRGQLDMQLRRHTYRFKILRRFSFLIQAL